MVKITWSEPAIDDLVAIGEFSGKYSEKYASTLIRKLFSKVEILKLMPEVGRIVPKKNEANVRELIEGNFRIIYQIKSETEIIVLIVHHSSRPLSI